MFKTLFFKDKVQYSNKRKAGLKNVLMSILAIMASFLLALLITVIVYRNGDLFTSIIQSIFVHPFSSMVSINNTLCSIAIFAVAATAFLIAMKCGLFNIGISGQMFFGGAMATIVANKMFDGTSVVLPNGLSQVILLLVAVVSSCAIASLIGVFKAFLNVNEVVTSIMFNWIIYFIATMLLAQYCMADTSGALQTQSLNNLANTKDAISTPQLVFQINGDGFVPLLIMAVVVIIVAVVILWFTTFGKKIINTGISAPAAQYAGYSTKKNQILTMAISGAIAGVLGIMVYLGKDTNMSTSVAAKTIPQEGFTGISVGLIAMSNPIGIIPVSVLFGMIESSKAVFGVDPSMANTIFGIVVYGAAVISLFYFLVPFKWYLRIFKGKAYADNYDFYTYSLNHSIDDIKQMIGYLKVVNKKDKPSINHVLMHDFKKYGIDLNKKISEYEVKKYINKLYIYYQIEKVKKHIEFIQNVHKQKSLEKNLNDFQKIKNDQNFQVKNTKLEFKLMKLNIILKGVK